MSARLAYFHQPFQSRLPSTRVIHRQQSCISYLLQRLVVDETCGILGDLELSFLNLFAELPEERLVVSWRAMSEGWRIRHSTALLISVYSHGRVWGPTEPLRATRDGDKEVKRQLFK
jgi:hypothetical protein